MKQLLIAVFISTFLFGCASPQKAFNKHLKSEDARFLVDTQTRRARYVVEYSVIKRFKRPVRVEVVFENPLDSKNPLTATSMITPGKQRIKLESPVISGMRNGKLYDIQIRGYRNKSNKLLFENTQSVKFFLSTGR